MCGVLFVVSPVCMVLPVLADASTGDAGKTGKTEEVKPKWEHFAYSSPIGYLDGPRVEAMGMYKGRRASNDPDGNCFVMWKYTTSWMQSVTVDGQVKTIIGDNRWTPDMNITEGPAAFFPNMHEPGLAGDLSLLWIAPVVYGYPLKGEDYGCIYIYFTYGYSYKVFKNKEKNDRWWFKRLGSDGDVAPPTIIGETASINDVKLFGIRIGQGWMTWNGNLYSFDEPKGTITCVLTPAYYLPKVAEELAKIGKTSRKMTKMKTADRMIVAEDGTMYLMHPWREGNVFRVSADRTKFEYIVQHNRKMHGSNLDGPGLETTWHCGPSWIKTSGDTLFLRAIDSVTTRRWRDGRVSVLCMDGEWREQSKDSDNRVMQSPSGMGYRVADHDVPYIYVHYLGAGGGFRMFSFGPADFTKPTVGSLVQNTAEDFKGKKK